MTWTRQLSRALTAGVVVAALTLSGCGTRASDAEIRAGVAGGPVSIDPSSVQGLVDPAANAATVTPGSSTPADPTAPGTADDRQGKRGTPQDSARPNANGKPAGPATTGSAEQRCGTQGAPVALGQVGVFSGVVGPIAGDALQTLAVWVKDINARGGLACHPVTLYVRDDGGDPARAAVGARELIKEKGVVAFLGNILALSMKGFLPEIQKDCIPAIGADIGNLEWASEECLFPQGGGLNEAIAGLVRSAADEGSKRIGLLYCVEAALCTQLVDPIKKAAARDGLELVYDAPISVTQPDFTAQCQNAKNANVQQLVLAMDGSSVARLARSCKALGYKPVLVTGGFALTAKQAEDPLLRSFDITAVAVNAPWFLTDQPGLREYQQALARYAPELRPAGMSSQVWASAKLLEAGVAKLGPR